MISEIETIAMAFEDPVRCHFQCLRCTATDVKDDLSRVLKTIVFVVQKRFRRQTIELLVATPMHPARSPALSFLSKICLYPLPLM